MAMTEQCERFFDRCDRDACAVVDPDASLNGPFGFERGAAVQFLSSDEFAVGRSAVLEGNLVVAPIGDVMRMSGAFLVRDEALHWRFTAEHVGHPSDLNGIARAERELESK